MGVWWNFMVGCILQNLDKMSEILAYHRRPAIRCWHDKAEPIVSAFYGIKRGYPATPLKIGATDDVGS